MIVVDMIVVDMIVDMIAGCCGKCEDSEGELGAGEDRLD
jgi:hypothetical protein